MHRRALLAAIVVSSALTSLPTTALVLALPAIHHDFHASVSELQWTLTSYSLAYSSLLVVGGRLGDLLGRVRFFEVGVVIWVGAAALGAAASNATVLIVAMGLLGLGSAALTPASLALLTSEWTGPQRTQAISAWALASSVVSGAGPTIGGVITAEASWRWIFGVVAVVAAATLALTVLAHDVDSRADNAAHPQPFHALLLVVGLTSVSLALIQGPQWELDSAPTLTIFAFGVLVLAWFLRTEVRDAVPLLELELLRVRTFVAGVIVKLGVNFALAAFLFFISLYLQEVLGYTAEQAGWGLLPLTAPFVAFAPVGSRLGARFGMRLPILLGVSISIVAFVLVTRLDSDLRYIDLLPSILLLGIGAGLVVTPMNAAPLNAIPQRQHGEAAAILQMTTGLGAVLGIALGGALFQEMHERRLTDFLGRKALSESTQRDLSGVLVHSPPAERALHQFDDATAATIVRGIREAYVFGVSTTMWLAAGVLAAGLVATLALMRPTTAS